jgi:hypothetical protein
MSDIEFRHAMNRLACGMCYVGAVALCGLATVAVVAFFAGSVGRADVEPDGLEFEDA